MANPVRCDSYSDHGNTVNSISSSINLVGSIDEKIIDRLRAQLLRIRVAGKLGQDFLMNKHIMELEALCREACTDNDAVLHTNVLRDLWDVLKHGRGEFWGARQCSPQPLCSLSEDAAAISKARYILQHATSKDAGIDKGGKRRSHHAMNPSRAEESIDHISSATVPSPADVLPLPVPAETLGASVAVNACLDSIHANQEEVNDIARTLFDPGVDWANAVARLAKWHRMAEKSPPPPPPPPPPRTLETAGFPARGEAIETISASGVEAEILTSPLADSGLLDEERQDTDTDRIRQCDRLENVKPTSKADRGQSLGKEEKGQPHTFKPTGNVNDIGRNEGYIARFARQGVIPETNSSQRHAYEVLGLENQSQPGEPLRRGSTETSWRFPPTASPAPSTKLSASIPQRPVLQAGRPGEEKRKKGKSWPIEASHCCSRESEGYYGRHRASTHRLELCSVECNIFHDFPDGRGQQMEKRAEQNTDAALDIGSSPTSHQKNETGKAIEQVPCLHFGDENLSDGHSTAPFSESEKRWSSETSLGLTPLSPKSCAVPFTCESVTPQRRKGLRRFVAMRRSQVREGKPSLPLMSKDVRSSSTREPSPERGFPVSTINSWISERVASREYENSCALARKRALLRVRLARQKSALVTAEECHREQTFDAERRRRRDEKLAELLLKTSGVAVLKQAVQRDGGVGDCDGGCHPGTHQGSPRIRLVTAKHAPSPFPSTTTVRDEKSTVDYSAGGEATPRRPLSIKPEKPGTMAWDMRNERNTGNRCTYCAAAAASKEYHYVCPDSAGMSTALSTLVVRIDALYSLPTRGSRPHGKWGKACTKVCMLLKAGCFSHRTTAQHPKCCKHETYRRLSYRRDSKARRTREGKRTDANRVGAFNVEHATWVFGETVILRFAPEGSDDRRSVHPNNLRVLVYGSGCKGSSSEDGDRSTSRDRRSVFDMGFDDAAHWGLVGVAILPLRGGHVAVGNPVGVGRETAGEGCSFSRSLVVSVEGTEGGHPIGLVEIGVCGTTTCGRS